MSTQVSISKNKCTVGFQTEMGYGGFPRPRFCNSDFTL